MTFMSEALRRAAQQGRTDFVRRLLDRGDEADAAEEEDGITALMYAAEKGHVDAMRLLLILVQRTKVFETRLHPKTSPKNFSSLRGGQ